MLRTLVALHVALMWVGKPVAAMDLQARSDEQWTVTRTIGGFGLVADLGRSLEPTGVGRHLYSTMTAGLHWQAGGFRAAASAGALAYDYSGAALGTARLASFAVSHRVTTTTGALSLELRHTRLWDGESQEAITAARVQWQLKF